MEKKLEKWKKEGYNTPNLESKVGTLSTKEMKDIMSKWKKEYSSKNTEGYKNKR